ncbi:YopX protein [Clostridium sp. DL-VIII]|uniref:hypothetical protein n=1 Tax=Clostridium sp. DL-VIII TaxID=641107 RepID=UPI00023AF7B5|nr:hypothetical protein [Clostridium sp. DL-VIII]EHI98017.1 YopX protein [Clostridium sp. DL-VIII]
MGFKLKFKLVDTKTNEVVDYINCSIAVADGTVQSFNRKCELEGTAVNAHLRPIQYANKDDINKKEIYQGFIVDRKGGVPGEEDIIGIVDFMECAWWIVNHKEQRAVPLFSKTAIDTIIGNIYKNKELYEVAGYE